MTIWFSVLESGQFSDMISLITFGSVFVFRFNVWSWLTYIIFLYIIYLYIFSIEVLICRKPRTSKSKIEIHKIFLIPVLKSGEFSYFIQFILKASSLKF